MFLFSLRFTIVLVVGAMLSAPACCRAEVDAVKGKRYSLDERHGPWMVMVASLRDVPEERRTEEGLSAWDAADTLVYELRKKGIPAYTFLQDQKFGRLNGKSAQRSASRRASGKHFIAQHQSIAVLAGNFRSVNDKNAKIILNYIKEDFDPSFLKEKNNGGIFARTPGHPRPTSRAFLVPNPLRSAKDIRQNTVSPEVRQLNADMEYSLLKNKGKYTLVIATFAGTSILQVGQKSSPKAMKWFSSNLGDNLDESGMDAWRLTEALRGAKKLGYDRDYEAWVFHDRFKSVVTLGSFDSPNDPRIKELARKFAAKTRQHPETGEDVQTAEVFSIPRRVPQGQRPDKMWLFDVKPALMEVPRVQ